jgi:hypothetical protein
MEAFNTSSTFLVDGDPLHDEVGTLQSALAAETERTAQLGAEVARLHASLYEANVMCGSVHRLRVERDAYKQKLDDQLQFKSGPLEARLLEANRVVFEQRLQLGSIVDYLAIQRDWVREWAILGQENLHLREKIKKRESGAEVEELRRTLLDFQSKVAENIITVRRYETMIAVHESKVRSFSMENERLMADNTLLKEQMRRLWNTHFGTQTVGEKRTRLCCDSENQELVHDQPASDPLNAEYS